MTPYFSRAIIRYHLGTIDSAMFIITSNNFTSVVPMTDYYVNGLLKGNIFINKHFVYCLSSKSFQTSNIRNLFSTKFTYVNVGFVFE